MTIIDVLELQEDLKESIREEFDKINGRLDLCEKMLNELKIYLKKQADKEQSNDR